MFEYLCQLSTRLTESNIAEDEKVIYRFQIRKTGNDLRNTRSEIFNKRN